MVTSSKSKAESETTETRLRRAGLGCWLALPACGTAFLMATTNKLCQDVAVVPFLWVLPPALYLISFIISFDSPRWYVRETGAAAAVSWIGVLWGWGRVWIWKSFCRLGFTVWHCSSVAWCHGNCTIASEPTRLTQYFLDRRRGRLEVWLWPLAPRWFDGYWEYHIALWGVGLLYLLVQCVNREPWR